MAVFRLKTIKNGYFSQICVLNRIKNEKRYLYDIRIFFAEICYKFVTNSSLLQGVKAPHFLYVFSQF